MKRLMLTVLVLAAVLTAAVPETGAQEGPTVRIKDIARIDGVRDNQLFGLGLVTGLDGTGDGAGAQANVQMIANMLERFGITVSSDDLRLRNVAAVMVTADVPSSLREGDRTDVTISSVGDARSLAGGYLLQTPLEAGNGEIYAAAQGSISLGQDDSRRGGHTTTGTIPNGAIVEKDIPSSFRHDQDLVTLVLQRPDFSTASRLTEAINAAFTANTAFAEDSATVRVGVPSEYEGNVVGFIAALEELPVQPDTAARVVVNERTGTVVMGASVRIAPVAVAHGGLSVRVGVSQSAEPAESELDGQIGSVPDGSEPGGTSAADMDRFAVIGGSSVEELVNALNAIGAGPQDVISILQAIKAAGALFGELVIM